MALWYQLSLDALSLSESVVTRQACQHSLVLTILIPLGTFNPFDLPYFLPKFLQNSFLARSSDGFLIEFEADRGGRDQIQTASLQDWTLPAI